MNAGKPPWWVWFEPPPSWPKWLHLATCTYCRGFRAHVRQLRQEATMPP